jgi:DNA-binding NarL/FixJ family response regulator
MSTDLSYDEIDERRAAYGNTPKVSPAQAVVLEDLQLGLTKREICTKRYVTMNTVRSHTSALFKIFDVHSMAELLFVTKERA